MCSLGTVLWLTLVPAGHLCSLNGVTVEINLCATCHIFALPSFVGQNSIITSISIQFLHCFLSYFSFSELKSNSKVSALNQKINQTLFVQVDFEALKCDFILQVLWLNALFGSNSNWGFLIIVDPK